MALEFGKRVKISSQLNAILVHDEEEQHDDVG